MLRKLLLGCVLGTLGSIPALALSAPERLTIGMTLEPPALDPTANAAETIADVTLYNIYETLTKIQEDGSVTPLLAESWTVSDDGRTYTFRLRDGVRFHNGAAMDAQTVRYAFERAGAENSTNKDRRHFSQWQIDTPDPLTVQITLPQADPDLPFRLGMMTAAIVEPGSAGTNATQPTGTGPYQLAGWQRGSRLQLKKWPDYRNASQVALDEVTIRFISDPAAQAAALLAGDIDAFPRIQASRSLPRLQQDSRFDIVVGGSRAKTMMAINQRRAPLDDVRVRRAILAAIDRDAVIEGAADGYGLPIGSFYTPGTPGYVDTTGINPYDPAKARALLQEAGVAQPLRLDLLLPPPPYARQGGGNHRRPAGPGWHPGPHQERRMGAVAGQCLRRRTRLRPHHRVACRAAGPREFCQPGLLHRLRFCGLPADLPGHAFGRRREPAPERPAGRATPTGRGCRRRLPVPTAMDQHRPQGTERHAQGCADFHYRLCHLALAGLKLPAQATAPPANAMNKTGPCAKTRRACFL
ncbi:hypothetical protein J2T35_002275 [Kerstersia gyiorum]|nr:hypothetical protein [Kerstersia gyiorum]